MKQVWVSFSDIDIECLWERAFIHFAQQQSCLPSVTLLWILLAQKRAVTMAVAWSLVDGRAPRVSAAYLQR